MIKINRKKLAPKLITVATIGIALFLFSTTVQGCTRTIRPIDHYPGEYAVFYDFGAFPELIDYEVSISAWYDPESGLWLYPHGVDWWEGPPGLEGFNFLFWTYKVLKDCPHGGFIIESEIDEEHVLITINLYASKVPFMVFSDDAVVDPPPAAAYNYPPICKGIMIYYFRCKILFNKGMLDDWFATWGRLPSLAEIGFLFNNPEAPTYYPPELQPVIQYVQCTGFGYVTEGEGRIAVVNQIGILDDETGEMTWPKETTIVIP